MADEKTIGEQINFQGAGRKQKEASTPILRRLRNFFGTEQAPAQPVPQPSSNGPVIDQDKARKFMDGFHGKK